MIELLEVCRNFAGVLFWLLADLFLMIIWAAVFVAFLAFIQNWLGK